LQSITLQTILLCKFAPEDLIEHLRDIASQHRHLKLAVRQCQTQAAHYKIKMQKRAAQNRDLLIKKMLFHADNGKTECFLDLNYDKELQCHGAKANWSTAVQQSVVEPDLFGRAVSVLVHRVLQSASLRVRVDESQSLGGQSKSLRLCLSWQAALHNLKVSDKKAVPCASESTQRDACPVSQKNQIGAIPNPLFGSDSAENSCDQKLDLVSTKLPCEMSSNDVELF